MKQFLLRLSISSIVMYSYGALALSTRPSLFNDHQQHSRRQWLSDSVAKAKVSVGIVAVLPTPATFAAEGYDNPNIPTAPEERCKHIL